MPEMYPEERFARLLLVEDEESLAGPMQRGLEEEGYHVDIARYTAHQGGQALELREKGFRLLELLLRLGGAVATRTLIAERVWGSAFDVTDNAIDVTVSNLRQRLSEAAGEGSAPVVIETVRGVGYRLRACHEGPTARGGS